MKIWCNIQVIIIRLYRQTKIIVEHNSALVLNTNLFINCEMTVITPIYSIFECVWEVGEGCGQWLLNKYPCKNDLPTKILNLLWEERLPVLWASPLVNVIRENNEGFLMYASKRLFYFLHIFASVQIHFTC